MHKFILFLKPYNVICWNYKKRTNKTQHVKMSEAFRKMYLPKSFAHFNILSFICPFFIFFSFTF